MFLASLKFLFSSFFLSGLFIASANAAGEVAAPNKLPSLLEVTAYEVEWKGRPRDPYVAPDGMVWFCGQANNYIARLDPESGEMKKFEVAEGSHPHNLIVDSKGFVWYAGNRNGHIGRIHPETGAIKQYSMPEGVQDPHTLVFDSDENIWFTAQHSNVIGHLNVETGDVQHVSMTKKRSRPYGIKTDANNNAWSVLLGTNKLAFVDKETFALIEVRLPRDNARPRRMEITDDGNVWYVDFMGGFLGRYNPQEKEFEEWLLPSGEGSRPYGTALDDEEVIWIAQTGPYPNVMVGFDTNRESFFSSTVVEEGGSIRHMYYDPDTDAFWFGIDTGYIAKGKMKGEGAKE
ncbi:lyase [Kangiella sp.]|uniref:Vgb family protein n=1 Tax=Kangiella sp. TaxID=1920245 RepID=UPI003A9193E8